MLSFLARLLFLTALTSPFLQANPVPAELDRALKAFRAEGPRGWAFIQTTESGGKSLVEHYDPSKRESLRWTLLKKDGAAPSESAVTEYRDRLSRRGTGTTPPDVKDQIDRETCELVETAGARVRYRFRLRPGATDDKSAAHMTATFTLHTPTETIEQVELAAFEPFSPLFMVRINEAKTTITYSLPEASRPTLLQKIEVHIRGRAFWFKSLDEDMIVTYSEHESTGRKPASL